MATLAAYDEAGNEVFGIEDEDEDEIAFYVVIDEDEDAGV